MSHKLTDEQIASVCLSYRHDFGLLPDEDKRRLMFEAREWERAFAKEHTIEAATLLARIAELEAERTRLRAAVVTARDGYISERATGKPVLESWRERTLEMLDKALGDNARVQPP